MTDRGLPGVEGPPACPFVAFEDERDERSTSPDHRHRCYAEVEPAPRALAHQEAYCLSSAFPVCPTFQDWARREAAQARSAGRTASAPPIGAAAVVASGGDDGRGTGPDADGSSDAAEDPEPAWAEPAPVDADARADDDPWSAPVLDSDVPAQRNPPRDWAAPPPWASGANPRPPASGGDRPPEFIASRSPSAGLVGSAADRIASGQPAAVGPSSPPSDDLAGLVAPAAAAAAGAAGAAGVAAGAGAAASSAPPLRKPPSGSHPTTTASGRRPTVSSTRGRGQAPVHDGPSWESVKRYEAYPTIKTRTGLPGIPRVLVLVGALAVAALALFFLPALLGIGGGGGGASPTPSVAAEVTASPSPTPVPVPTAQTYTIKKGDTLLKIAKKFDVTLEQLLKANKATIKNADKIKVGQEIIIPVPVQVEFTDPDAQTPATGEETPEP